MIKYDIAFLIGCNSQLLIVFIQICSMEFSNKLTAIKNWLL